MSAWRALFRIAARESWQAKGRTALICLLIGLPIAAATATDVVIATQDVTPGEAPDRFLGQSQALVEWQQGKVTQSADAQQVGINEQVTTAPDTATILDVLGNDRPSVTVSTSYEDASWQGVIDGYLPLTSVDWHNPLAAGIFTLKSGRLPAAPNEVAAPTTWMSRFPAVDSVTAWTTDTRAEGGIPLHVVGEIVWSNPQDGGDFLVAPQSAIPSSSDSPLPGQRWLVGGGPVSWEEVTKLNALGFSVISREVLRHPPSIPEIDQYAQGYLPDVVQYASLIVLLTILEISLLAGPAMAVSARRTVRSTALLAIAGGSTRQVRGVTLARALVLGVWAAVVGVVSGILTARLIQPIVERRWEVTFGPFDVPWWHVLGFALVGVVSAVAAGTLPAWRTARTDPLGSLTGTPVVGDARSTSGSLWTRLWGAPSWWGVLFFGAAVVLLSMRAVGSSELRLLTAVVLVVLAMTLLVPVGVRGVARLAERAGSSLRYSLRDAERHAGRTVPAVAAVAATVLGVVTLAVGASSDAATNRAEYSPSAAQGWGLLSVYQPDGDAPDAKQLAAVAAIVDEQAADVTPFPHVVVDADGESAEVSVSVDGSPTNMNGIAGFTDVSVAEPGLVDAQPGLTSAQRAQARAALADHRAVVLGRNVEPVHELTLSAYRWGGPAQPSVSLKAISLPITVGTNGRLLLPPDVELPPGLSTRQDGFWLQGSLTKEQVHDLRWALFQAGVDSGYDRGRGTPPSPGRADVLATIVIGALAALVMLIGTITATLLALSDARDDLATLAAVGGTPGDRRRIAGATAFVISGLGLLYGVVFAVLPAYAAARMASARSFYSVGVEEAVRTYDVPWSQLAWLLLLPVITVAAAVLVARKTPAWTTDRAAT